MHGLLGFSQGACAAALYAAHCTDNASLPQPEYFVLIAGFLPRDEGWARTVTEAGMPSPSLHVFGASDCIIDSSRSIDLAESFSAEQATRFQHPGAHLVPTCTGEFRDVLRTFLTSRAACAAQ